MTYENVIFDTIDEVAKITINRPNKLNAMDIQTMTELANALDSAERDECVKVVVLNGAGNRAFCTGADIAIFKSFFVDPMQAREFWTSLAPKIHVKIEKLGKPVIAAVQGYCLGGGLELALACDLLLATDDSKFGFPEINFALIPGWGGSQRIARVLGRQKAKELVMLGSILDAHEAEKLGIVNRVMPADALDKTVNEYTNKFRKLSPIALKLSKVAVNQAYELDLPAGLSYEAELDTILINTQDAKEGVTSFLEKRTPHFVGK